MAQPQIYEGTLDEIVRRYGSELSGRHLKVIVDNGSSQVNETSRPLYESASPQEWEEALRTWASSHNVEATLLSEEALDRESIYEGRGE